ncbi:MAG TPA: tetratricopeptide repeat protein, partial [Thermoanaerobaculia bacterium]|nr:tetratricopeptide repeat protein [Thermoanaerobaculia bacterium]
FLDPEQLAERLAFQKRLVDEETEARALCDRILTGPSAWWGNAVRNAGPPTSGLVRALIDRAAGLMQQAPTDALVLAKLAAEAADNISVSAYPYEHVYRIRGEALREEAWFHSFLGNFAMAAKVADRAERAFKSFPLPLEVDLARLDLVRANIAFAAGRFGDAAGLATRAGETFLWYGDRRRWMKSCDYLASAYWQMGDYKRAMETYQEQRDFLDLLTHEQRAMRFHNIAICARELGDLDGAILFFTRSLAEAEPHGFHAAAASTRASLGVVLLLAGKTGEAIDALRCAWRDLEGLGLQFNAAMTALRLVEALLIAERADEVPSICRNLIDRCTQAGMSHAAMTALAFLREAVEHGLATPQHARHVHDLLRDGDAREQFVPMKSQ